MARMRNNLSPELSTQVTRLGQNARTGLPIGLGTPGDRAVHPLEEIAATAGREAAARRERADALWENSPYRSLRKAANQSKGVIGELLTKSLFEQVFDLEVKDAFTLESGTYRPATKYDEMIARLGSNDSKLSTQGVSGNFRWGNINPGDEQYVMLWGVTPDRLLGWLVPTVSLVKLLDAKRQGAPVLGLSLSRGEYSLTFNAQRIPTWMNPFGGDESLLRARVELELSK